MRLHLSPSWVKGFGVVAGSSWIVAGKRGPSVSYGTGTHKGRASSIQPPPTGLPAAAGLCFRLRIALSLRPTEAPGYHAAFRRGLLLAWRWQGKAAGFVLGYTQQQANLGFLFIWAFTAPPGW